MKKHNWPYNIIAKFYDYDMTLNMPFDDTKAYLNMIGKTPGKLMELGAGNGRLTLSFLNAGWDILAIDRSQPMLNELLIKTNNSPYKDKLKCLYANVEDLIDLDTEYFDVVILPYSIICYLLDSRKIHKLLKNIRKSLKSNGLLIVDAFVPNIDSSQKSEFTQDYQRQTPFGILSRYKRINYDFKPNINLIERRYTLNSKNQMKEYETFSYIKPYTPNQLCKLIKNSNFQINAKYFDYSLNGNNKKAKFFTLTATKEP